MTKHELTGRPHVMLDLETLDVTPSAVTYEVGLAVFELYALPTFDIKSTSLFTLHTRDQGNRTINFSTIQWMKNAQGRAHAYLDALATGESVSTWADTFCNLPIWTTHPIVFSQGTDFDFPILESLLKQAGRQPPWKYNQKMDVRTIRRLAQQMGMSEVRMEPAHDALEDAKLQVRQLAHALHYLDTRPYKNEDNSLEALSFDGGVMSDERSEA